MRDLRTIAFLLAGVVLAGLTGLALYGVAQRTEAAPPAIAAARTVDVVVATADVPMRTVIVPDQVALRSYPADLVPAGALANVADAVGQTTLTAIGSGQAVVRSHLLKAEGRRGASLTVQPGKVIVAFPSADPLTANGLVSIGDTIDILASVTAGENARVTQTTLQGLEVMDILGPTEQQPSKVTSLVFAVDHQVALVLKYLRDAQATVDLAIRSRAERDLARTTSVDISYIVTTYGFRR